MNIIDQSHEILNMSHDAAQMIELAGRTCYKSEDKLTDASADAFVRTLIKRGHNAVLEFGSITVKFVTDRGVTHELVRHRLCSFAQESTRYCDYGKGGVTFVRPVWLDHTDSQYSYWLKAAERSEDVYKLLRFRGWTPGQARTVLPNSLKAEIVVSANIREWRHLLALRCSKKAHPQMRALMRPLLDELKTLLPALFDDITY